MPAIARVSTTEPAIVRVADGLYAERIDRLTPLPRRLETLLTELKVTAARTVRVIGTRRACTDAKHDLQPWKQGVYRDFEVRLAICTYCTVVEVRDISLDLIPAVTVGRGGPRRRDDLLGWYSGRRPGGRTYL